MTEGVGEAVLCDFDIPLVSDEGGFQGVRRRRSGSVESFRVAVFEGVSPGPETFPKASADGRHKERVGVVEEKFFEATDVNWCDDFEKGGIFSDGVQGDGIGSFGERRARKGECRFRPLGDGWGEARIRIPNVVAKIFGARTESFLIRFISGKLLFRGLPFCSFCRCGGICNLRLRKGNRGRY